MVYHQPNYESPTRSPMEGSGDTSPFEAFGLAKKNISNVFYKLADYLDSCTHLSLESPNESSHIFEELEGYKSQVTGLLEVLKRNNMKAVVIARTSSGKSTLINALLGAKILPTGLGHITNCFVQVEGADILEPHLVKEGSSEPQSISSINDLANALNSGSLGDNSLVHVVWPKSKCPVLSHDVVLVDSPGVDVTADLDESIDKYCLDADVFVLVANSESTLMNSEKRFFHKVNAKLSKPNVFIVHNRWDASMYDDNAALVKLQHTQRSESFLGQELGVTTTPAEAADRIFFVSAKEALQARLKTGLLPEGFEERYKEFEDFEQKFGECLTKSAIQTKFGNVVQRGESILSASLKALDNVCTQQSEKRSQLIARREELLERLKRLQEGQQNLSSSMQQEAIKMQTLVVHKLQEALPLPRLLTRLVNSFGWQFDPNNLDNTPYEEELQKHILNGLNDTLRAAQIGLAKTCYQCQRAYIEQVAELLTTSPEELSQKVVPHEQQLDYQYTLDKKIFGNFAANLEFKFFLFEILSLENATRTVDHVLKVNLGLSDAMTQKVGHGCLIAVPIIAKNYVSNRAVLLGALGAGAGCTGLYYYQKHRWNTQGKEAAFKSQLVCHSMEKTDYVLEFIAQESAAKVKKLLTHTFTLLEQEMKNEIINIQEELETFESNFGHFARIAERAQKLKEVAAALKMELDNFSQRHLNKPRVQQQETSRSS